MAKRKKRLKRKGKKSKVYGKKIGITNKKRMKIDLEKQFIDRDMNTLLEEERLGGAITTGGGFLEDTGRFLAAVGSKVPDAMVTAGEIGLATGAVASFIAPEFGIPFAAVSGASAGIGRAFGGKSQATGGGIADTFHRQNKLKQLKYAF